MRTAFCWPTWQWNLLRRVTRAAALSSFAYYCVCTPLGGDPGDVVAGLHADARRAIFAVIDAPVRALAAIVTPIVHASPYSLYWSPAHPPLPALYSLGYYLAGGVPAWLLVFYAPALGRVVWAPLLRLSKRVLAGLSAARLHFFLWGGIAFGILGVVVGLGGDPLPLLSRGLATLLFTLAAAASLARWHQLRRPRVVA